MIYGQHYGVTAPVPCGVSNKFPSGFSIYYSRLYMCATTGFIPAIHMYSYCVQKKNRPGSMSRRVKMYIIPYIHIATTRIAHFMFVKNGERLIVFQNANKGYDFYASDSLCQKCNRRISVKQIEYIQKSSRIFYIKYLNKYVSHQCIFFKNSFSKIL